MNGYLNFTEYLTRLSTSKTANSTLDYGLYLEDIASLQKFAHYSSTLMFLIDYTTRSYPYIDRGTVQVLGHPKGAFHEGGLEFSLSRNIHFDLLNQEIFADRANFLKTAEILDLQDIRFSMAYGYKDANGKIRNLLQRHTITELTDERHPKGIFGFCWDITDQGPKEQVYHSIEVFNHTSENWESVFSKQFFPGVDPDVLLSKRELEVLRWMSDGLLSKQIAEKLNVSKFTIDTHRKNMLRKTNSKNIAELVAFVTRTGLLQL